MRIAVTVDMIATGTDIKPLECVLFLRDVRSSQYFEQMKGRGARTIDPTDFQAVTPDAATKTRFVLVDAVGVTEHDFVEPPLNRDRSISLEKLLGKTATMTHTESDVATLASRLTALELQLTSAPRSSSATYDLASSSATRASESSRTRRQQFRGYSWRLRLQRLVDRSPRERRAPRTR